MGSFSMFLNDHRGQGGILGQFIGLSVLLIVSSPFAMMFGHPKVAVALAGVGVSLFVLVIVVAGVGSMLAHFLLPKDGDGDG